MPDKNIISRVVDWLSVGYPKDVPVQDRAAVMAILKMRLNDEQLQEVVRRLMQSRAARGEAYVSDQRINEYIRRVVDHAPTPQDIDRVAKILGAHGFLISETHVNDDVDADGHPEYVAYEDPTTGEIRIAELAAAGVTLPNEALENAVEKQETEKMTPARRARGGAHKKPRGGEKLFFSPPPVC